MREIWPSQNPAKFRKIRREICAQEHHGALAVVPQRDGVGGGREAELQRRQRAERTARWLRSFLCSCYCGFIARSLRSGGGENLEHDSNLGSLLCDRETGASTW